MPERPGSFACLWYCGASALLRLAAYAGTASAAGRAVVRVVACTKTLRIRASSSVCGVLSDLFLVCLS